MSLDDKISITRTLAIIDNVSFYLEKKYGIPFDFSQDKGVQYLSEHQADYNNILNIPDASVGQIEKKLFFTLKDFVRKNSELFQKTIDEDGVQKRMWFSPYLNKIVFDEIEELGLISTLADEPVEDLKELFYKSINQFDLNDKERLFIDLCFSGYNP